MHCCNPFERRIAGALQFGHCVFGTGQMATSCVFALVVVLVEFLKGGS